jgi:hypothetical protein
MTSDEARRFYPRLKLGFALGQDLVPERLLTGAEDNEMHQRLQELEAYSAERDAAVRALHRGLISGAPGAPLPTDDTPCTPLAAMHPGAPSVPSLDLVASELIAVKLLGSTSNLLAESLNLQHHQPLTIAQQCGMQWNHEVTVLLRSPGGYDGARVLHIERDQDGQESYRRDADTKLVLLPCAPVFARWSGRALNPCPPNILGLLQPPDTDSLVGQLVTFYRDGFELVDGPASNGMRLGALIDLTARVNGFERADLAQSTVLDALAVVGVEKKRANDGMRYLVRPKADIKPIARVRVQDIDVLEWDLFKQWKVARDTPARRERMLREQAERERQATAKTEHETMWGSRPKDEIQEILKDHAKREAARGQAAALAGVDFRPMPPHYAVPRSGEVPSYAERLAQLLAESEAAA